MSRSQRPRKAYRPKPLNGSAIHDAFARRSQMAFSQQLDLLMHAHNALAALRTGDGAENHAEMLAVSMNLTMLLTEIGVGKDRIHVAIEGQTAVVRCKERAERLGKWGLDGPGITAIRAALDLHGEQIKTATQKQMSAAIAEMHRRVAMPEHVMKVEKQKRSHA